jgi:GT2 family glycosyltransferase
MKALICMAIFDSDSNKRTEYTKQAITSLIETTNPDTTRISLIDNASCQKTKNYLKSVKRFPHISVFTNEENEGTASAINRGLQYRQEGEYVVKIDNDIVIHRSGWVEEMIGCFENSPSLGILGLKRKDLPNSPYSKEYPTSLQFLHHELGGRWHIVEECHDIIGSCTMYNHLLLDKIGYLYQPGLYGFDDVLISERSVRAGFYNAFYPCVEIDHIDDGKNPFTQWKQNHAGIHMAEVNKIIGEYRDGIRSIYYNPYE